MLSFRKEEKNLSKEDKAIAVYMLQYNFSDKPDTEYPVSLRSFVSRQLSYRLRHKLDLNTGYIMSKENPFRLL